jgi:probable rRNA maturation factor
MPRKSTNNKIRFFFLTQTRGLRERTRLKTFITRLFSREGIPLESLNYIFCSDSYLLEINRRYLGHDFFTDIISFDLGAGEGPVTGEIYISLERVRENARANGQTLKNELHRVVFHGALHLCGYRDKKDSEIREMRKMEDYYLNLYFK